MWKEQLYYDYVYVVHDFLNKTECDEYIHIAEGIGFVDAPITTSRGAVINKEVRNNNRLIVDDTELANQLWKRAEPWVVKQWRGREAIGLNERFRFYRYEPGQRFAPHFDGHFERANGDKSEFTFLIYLNDDFEGGTTGFLQSGRFFVQPKAGSLLLFHHPQLHEGAEVESGIKYVLRSDVMYSRQT